ncbi:MAG: NADP-dependent isocitrate dehydrogenase [Dokdonella sp.]|nr:NADP-dependent isocitrate dehydrogenase [Dokdonella sp.]
MLSCRTAVAFASASAASFFACGFLQNGRTNCAAVILGCKPYAIQRRAHWCAPPHASIATTVPAGTCASHSPNASRLNSCRDCTRPVALADNEARIIGELNGAQGKPVDIGGYYRPDPGKLAAAMRPSASFNTILSDLAAH